MQILTDLGFTSTIHHSHIYRKEISKTESISVNVLKSFTRNDVIADCAYCSVGYQIVHISLPYQTTYNFSGFENCINKVKSILNEKV